MLAYGVHFLLRVRCSEIEVEGRGGLVARDYGGAGGQPQAQMIRSPANEQKDDGFSIRSRKAI